MTDALKLRSRLAQFLMIFAAAFLMANPGQVRAQTAVEADRLVNVVAKTIADLPPASRAVMERLSGLRELPDGTWKLHSGDLAHGEALSLDESRWQAIQNEAKAPTRCRAMT